MPKRKPIPQAKPTRYRGQLFRSRLEAKWAIVFDTLPNVLTWKYEPKTYFLPDKHWDYTPDFLVTAFHKGERFTHYIEVKPRHISPEYENVLQQFVRIMKHPLVTVCSELYPNAVNDTLIIDSAVYGYDPKSRRDVKSLFPLSVVFPGIANAVAAALNHRFDLA